MPETATYQRLAWKDYFNLPTIKELRKALPPEAVAQFDDVHAQLCALDGVEPELKWYGHCWYWTIAYTCGHGEEPLALIIPSPEDLQLAMPLDKEFIESLPMRRMRRSVRDGLDLARDPFDSRWGFWSLSLPRLPEDLVDLVETKLKHLRRAAG